MAGGQNRKSYGGDTNLSILCLLQVIYVVRNPKDVVVSYYHFQRMAKFFPDPASFEGFLHEFMAGTGKWKGSKDLPV